MIKIMIIYEMHHLFIDVLGPHLPEIRVNKWKI